MIPLKTISFNHLKNQENEKKKILKTLFANIAPSLMQKLDFKENINDERQI
jgi:hypothetical protein